jgi:hypothetical protein
MNLAGKITTAASVLVVGGLVALAAPAVVSTAGDLSSWAIFSPDPEPTADAKPWSAPPTLGEAKPPLWEAEAVSDEATAEPIKDRTHGDCELLYYPQDPTINTPRLDAPIETGVREFAEGTVELVDGIPTLYTVAPGDAMFGIGTRFCTFSAGLFYFNDVHLQGTIQPGDVLRLR